MLFWDDNTGGLIDGVGKGVRLLFIGSKEQADRWLAAGYDLEAAGGRYATFRADWSNAASAYEADSAASSFAANETKVALQEGLPLSDPDFWRIGAVTKNLVW